MKVLIVAESVGSGGASRAAYRLHRSLLSLDIDSIMLVQRKYSDDYTVITAASGVSAVLNKGRPFVDKIPTLFYRKRTKTLFSSAWFGLNNIAKQINQINPDIVHFHWVAGGMVKIEDVRKINSTIVWSLHDMWPFTGGCHYDESCGRYDEKCGNCKVLASNFVFDLSRWVYNRKYKVYSKVKSSVIVGTSKWIATSAKKSSLLKERNVCVLPNPIDTQVFNRISKRTARAIFNLPTDKKLILFAATNSLSDPRKGSKQLLEALGMLDLEGVALVIAGASMPKQAREQKYPVYYISPLHDDVSLSLMYNTADVMVVPSVQENMANSVVESLSCGVPVVAFDVGGNKDMIDHKKNGYLAKAIDSIDLSAGIKWTIESKNYRQLADNARNKALKEFEKSVVARKYIELYRNEVLI